MEAIETEHRRLPSDPGAAECVTNPVGALRFERYGRQRHPQLEFFDKDGQVGRRSLAAAAS